ncbi:MAG TPA: NAD(P)/FAD-dependent oxidoreductase, partial [Blastocatellia bacterium]|nr:NAD(P)/FAD-dependent oxidoreductase [Blastocatellia bacterium]
RLGVLGRLMTAGGPEITKITFYSPHGRSVSVPSKWLGPVNALSLSRAEMDFHLLDRAREVGATVLEDAKVKGLIIAGGKVRGVLLEHDGQISEYRSDLTIDATGRARALSRKHSTSLGRKSNNSRRHGPLVAFKAHFKEKLVQANGCEIYFYPGGYGGLSQVEDNMSNLCFIVPAEEVQACAGNPEELMHHYVLSNFRASEMLRDRRAESSWLSVSIDAFGRNDLIATNGLIAIGDAASFIDPFTGSGILMALESGELAAEVILRWLPALKAGACFSELAAEYRARYLKTFSSRLRVCKWLRHLIFAPGPVIEATILTFGFSERLLQSLASLTRHVPDLHRRPIERDAH